jgi:hypothetical protein
MKTTVFITSPLAPENVKRIREVDPERLEVIYDPELLPPMRFESDHVGAPFTRAPDQERRWRDNLARAEVLWDFPSASADGTSGLADAPRVKWIQGTSAASDRR